MSKRNKNRNETQIETTNNASDAEFGVKFTEGKKDKHKGQDRNSK